MGNVRLSYKKNGTVLQIVEEDNYYAFGLKHQGYNTVVNSTNIAQNLLFGGKELNKEQGLSWYDFGARNYDAALGRWMNIDPLAEKSRRWSPYTYAYNNPIYFVDPDGMEGVGFLSESATQNVSMTTTSYADVKTGGEAEKKDSKSSNYKNFFNQAKSSFDNTSINTTAGSEPPVNFFRPTSADIDQKPFNDWFNLANQYGNYNVGDNKFSVYGHGSIGQLFDSKRDGAEDVIITADQFDDIMSSRSDAYRIASKANTAFELTIFACNSGNETSTQSSIARLISIKHQNATIIGFKGYVYANGKGIQGVGLSNKKNNNDGYVVKYRGGKEIERVKYTEYIKNNKL